MTLRGYDATVGYVSLVADRVTIAQANHKYDVGVLVTSQNTVTATDGAIRFVVNFDTDDIKTFVMGDPLQDDGASIGRSVKLGIMPMKTASAGFVWGD